MLIVYFILCCMTKLNRIEHSVNLEEKWLISIYNLSYTVYILAQRVERLPCMRPTWVRFLCPSKRVRQATESIPTAWQSLASCLWHIRYAKNSSNKSHNEDVTGAHSSKSMNNGTTVLCMYVYVYMCIAL